MKLRISNIKELFVYTLSFVISAGLAIYMATVWDRMFVLSESEYLFTLQIVLLMVYAWAFIAWGLAGHRYCCIYILFLLYSFTSNAGQVFINLIDPTGEYLYSNLYSMSTSVLCQIMIFQSACISFLNFGALCGAHRRLKKRFICNDGNARQEFLEETNHQYSMLAKALFVVVCVLVLFDAISYVSIRRVLSYAQATSSAQDAPLGTYVLYTFSVLAFYLLFKANGRKLRNLLMFILFIAALYFLAGKRTAALPLICCIIIVCREKYPQMFKKKNIPLFVVGSFLLLSLSSIVVIIRTGSIGSVLVSSAASSGVLQLAKQAIYEMGMAARCIGTTISAFSSGNVVHEQTILYSLILAIVPRPLLEGIGISAPAIGSLSAFATGSNTSGAGFSFIAEFFFDFGLYACIPIMIYGFVIAIIEAKADDALKAGKLFFAAVVYTILCKQVFFARGQFDYLYNFLRNSVYLAVLWYLFSGRLTETIRLRGNK